MKGPFPSMESAEKEFNKKFKEKTRNDWSDRDNFVPQPGKYTLIEMGDEDDNDDQAMVGVASRCGYIYHPFCRRLPMRQTVVCLLKLNLLL